MTDLSPQEKIQEAAFAIIAEEGFQNVTTRKIAARAGVNLAAINYYFGSKDKVINTVAESLAKDLKQSFEHLAILEVSPEVRLRNFIISYGQSLLQYPDLIRMFMYQKMKNNMLGDYQHFLVSDGIKALQQTILELTGCSSQEARMKAMQLLGAIVFSGLMGNMTKTVFQIDMNNHDEQMNYFNTILQNFTSH